VRWWGFLFPALVAAGPASAQGYEIGRSAWQVERLSDGFVLLRTEIHQTEAGARPRRQGLFVLTCDRQSRRIRFQLGETPRQPSIEATQFGRAIVRGRRDGAVLPGVQLNPRVRFFDDGSFELLEAVGFGDATMAQFLRLLKKLPAQLEVVLFRGPETGVFLRGTALQFDVLGLDESLVNLYGFEGLCFRAAE
jgi:hypothetical protein